jgi:hypothetical protein
MEDFYPNRYSFHCECKILNNYGQYKNKRYILNTKYDIGDINFLTRRFFLMKYKKR